MQAIILAGGKATRLRHLYADRPKALVPIAGKPFLLRQIEWLASGGIGRVHVAAGYLANMIEDWVAGAPLPIPVTVSAEPVPLGTAGGLKFCEPHLASDPFVALNGDTLVPALRFDALAAFHAGQKGSLASIGVVKMNESGRYGTVEFAADGKVTAFREKAARESGWVSAGVYLVSKAALARIGPGANVSIETDVFPALAARRELSAFPADPPMFDMGTEDGIRALEAWVETV